MSSDRNIDLNATHNHQYYIHEPVYWDGSYNPSRSFTLHLVYLRCEVQEDPVKRNIAVWEVLVKVEAYMK